MQGNSGTLNLTLDSKTGGQHGRIKAAGTVTADGTLTITNDGLTFADGDSFDIFNGTISGTWDTINLPALTGNLHWNTVDLYTTGTISVGEPMIITVDTNNGLTVDLRLFGTLSNVDIDWGDGNGSTPGSTAGTYNNTYASATTYTIKVFGSFTGYGWESFTPTAANLTAITGVTQWNAVSGSTTITSLSGAFRSHVNLTSVPATAPTGLTTLNRAFNGATNFNSDISGWNVSSVTDMERTFYAATAFNQNIGSWNVSSVTTMESTFADAVLFNQNIGSWDVSSVTNMYYMFHDADAFNQDIGNWNVSAVANMQAMLEGLPSFNQDVGNWDVSAVTNMRYMFRATSNFNQDIGNWNVSSVADMNGMLQNTAFDQDISSWNVASVTDIQYMLTGTALSIANYEALLVGWDALELQDGLTFDAGSATYTSGSAAATARANIIATDSWTINDGGEISNSATWDNGAADGLISSDANWSGDPTLTTGFSLNLDSGSDAVSWDAGLTTLSNLTLSNTYSGTVTGAADTDLTVTNTLTVNAGTFATDAVVSVTDYLQGNSGTLNLILDSKTGGQHGRINASGTVNADGTLTITNDGLTFADGDSFDIFNGTISGTWDTINLPTLTGNLHWNTVDLYTTGTISVGEPMIITIDTNYGLTVSLSIEGTLSNVDIDWGDGNVSTPKNIYCMFTTAAVFQLPMALLKLVASLNISDMVVTADVSQLFKL